MGLDGDLFTFPDPFTRGPQLQRPEIDPSESPRDSLFVRLPRGFLCCGEKRASRSNEAQGSEPRETVGHSSVKVSPCPQLVV